MGADDPDQQAKKLLAEARQRAGVSRDHFRRVADDLFFRRTDILTKHERGLLHRILGAVTDEVEQRLRACVRRREPCSGDERMLIATLDRDTEPVAYPLLIRSGVLADPVLVESAWHRLQQYQLAVRLGRSALPSPRLDYSQLSTDLARELCFKVAAALRKRLVEQGGCDETLVDDLLEGAIEELHQADGWEPARSASRTAAPADTEAHEQLIAFLRAGDVDSFEAALAQMSGMRPQLIARMAYERGGEALATICVALGMTKRIFAGVYLLSRETRPGPTQLDADEVAHALSFFDELRPTVARQVLARWRRSSGYLNAIRLLSAAGQAEVRRRARTSSC